MSHTNAGLIGIDHVKYRGFYTPLDFPWWEVLVRLSRPNPSCLHDLRLTSVAAPCLWTTARKGRREASSDASRTIHGDPSSRIVLGTYNSLFSNLQVSSIASSPRQKTNRSYTLYLVVMRGKNLITSTHLVGNRSR